MTDPWLRSAMFDDALVAQLLLRLHQTPDSDPPHPSTKFMLTTASGSLFPVEWGMRQPRSKSASATTTSAGTVKKEGECARRSPMTPLSWSGGGGGGASPGGECEESSLPSDLSPATVRSKLPKGSFVIKVSHTVFQMRFLVATRKLHTVIFVSHHNFRILYRSLFWKYGGARSVGPVKRKGDVVEKRALGGLRLGLVGVGTNENTNTINKRSRKKKTFAELKEEESLLLKEQSYLEKELATIRVTLQKQRSLNHSLKRQKIDFQLESRSKSGVALSETVAQSSTTGPSRAESSTLEETPSCSPKHVKNNKLPLPESRSANATAGHQEQVFMLPDLNLLQDLNMLSEDFGPEILVGAS
ncbi:hypothetical protein AKJ16_DCAP19879 [Drosera capensis]